MTLNFPNSPIVGQEYENFVWNGSTWVPAQTLPGGLPAGSIISWGGSVAPANWLLCDGSIVSRTTYASLFAAIGTAYGAGNGSTTFQLPDLRGRVPVGRNGGSFGSLGATGGAETVTLTEAQMPSHTHIQNAHNHIQDSHNHTQNPHNHGLLNGGSVLANGGGSTASISTGGGGYVITSINNATPTNNPTTATNQPATATNQNTGGGQAHNNVQPYQVVNYIIKATAASTPGDSELAGRVGSVENVNVTQNTRLASIESLNETQNTRLANLETTITPVGVSSRYTAGGIMGTSYATYVTVNIAATGRPLLVNMSGTYSNANSSANRFVDFRVQLDGVTVGEELTGLFAPWFSGNQAPLTTADNFLVTPSSGNRVFTLQAKANNVSSVALFRASLVVTQL